MDPLTPDQTQHEGEQRKLRLQILGLNDPEPEVTFDRVARLAATLAQAPLAMVNFISDERQLYRGMHVRSAASQDPGDREEPGDAFDLSDTAETAREAPLDYGFCTHVIAQGSYLAVDDVVDHPRFKGNAFVTDMGVRSYLGTPLIDNTGMTLGTVCVADRRPRRWGAQHSAALHGLTETLLPEFQLRDSLLTHQQELFAVFDGAPFPIMLTQGPDHLLRFANARQGAAFGRVRQLSAGRSVLPGLDAVGVFSTMDRAYHTGQVSVLVEARIASYDASSPQTFTFTCNPVRLSPQAPVSGVLTMAVNMTSPSYGDRDPQQLAADLASPFERQSSGSSNWPASGQRYESSV